MRIWCPVKRFEKENIPQFINRCNTYLSQFRMILQSNINIPSMKRIEKILKERDFLLFVNKERFSILQTLNQYISSLNCYYDESENKCYFDIAGITRCINTKNSLQFVIRLIEFGNDIVPPTNWIRHSYVKFLDFIGDQEVEKIER